MQFKLQKQFYNNLPVYIVYPSGYDYGRGFSTLVLAFAHIKVMLRNS